MIDIQRAYRMKGNFQPWVWAEGRLRSLKWSFPVRKEIFHPSLLVYVKRDYRIKEKISSYTWSTAAQLSRFFCVTFLLCLEWKMSELLSVNSLICERHTLGNVSGKNVAVSWLSWQRFQFNGFWSCL